MSTLRAVDLIKTAAENIDGFTFITGTRFLSNIEADDISLPICILDRPVRIPITIESGGLLKEQFSCTVLFFNKSELEYQFEQHEPIIGAMKLAADQFIVNLVSFNQYIESVSSIVYTDLINALDTNLTGVQVTFDLSLYPLDEQVCPTGAFTPPDLPPFSRYLTEVAVDGVTITGNGTESDPLVAIGGGGGGGGSLRVQDEGTTVTNAATTLNFTGNVTASLASAGNVTVNVPAETPQVNSDWNAASGVAEILNKPSIPAAQIQSDWNQANNAALDFIKNKPTIPSTSGLVPYTGATQDVNLGVNGLTAHDLTVSHPSGSGVAASITKGGSGEALTVVKSSGSGNAASITGGVTLISELHLTTDLADSYIASAATWNAKQDTLTEGTGIDITSNVVTNTAPDQTVVLNNGTGIAVTGTYPNFTIENTSPAPTIWASAADGTIVTGNTNNNVSATQQINANEITVGDWIRITARVRKVGPVLGSTFRVYVNSTANLSGSPILIGTLTIVSTNLFIQLSRHLAIKESNVTEVFPASVTIASDIFVSSSVASSLNINWGNNAFFVFALQNQANADSTVVSGFLIEKL